MDHVSQYTPSSRREVLKQTGLAAAALMAGGRVLPARAEDVKAGGGRQRSLRIAHVTDIHVKPESDADKWFTKCLHHLQENHRPDLVVSTGDAIWDSLSAEESRVKALWDLSMRIWKSECSIPVEHSIGNHDIWGVEKAESKTTGNEPLYGKKWVMSLHEWERPYRSFDRRGWHFIALDTVQPVDDHYIGHIDEAQFEWLAHDLARVDAKTPVLVFGHIPLLSAAAFFKSRSAEKSGEWHVPASVMSIDARRMKDLFLKYPNVKIALSGHLHLVDRVDYLGVSYICGGAVAGGWWKGKNQEFEPGYNILDVYSDGTFEHKYVSYGWKPKA